MLKTLGMRHIALNVKDPQATKKFYIDVLKMEIEWEPDADNVYLTSSSQDNLAIHKAPNSEALKPVRDNQLLDHIGFFVSTPKEVDDWYQHVLSHYAKIIKEIKTHRDGARSFYFQDPDGVVIQLIYHPPVANRKS